MTVELAEALLVAIGFGGLAIYLGRPGGSPSKKAADEILGRLAKQKPDLRPVTTERRHGMSIELPGFWVLTLDETSKGVQAHVSRPGLPGVDDPPFDLRIYHYESVANMLVRYSNRTVNIYDLRVGAVYVVLKDFTDHSGRLFTAGTRLTFERRNYLPYEGGHTLTFREANVYVQDGDPIYARFEEYFGLTDPQGAPA